MDTTIIKPKRQSSFKVNRKAIIIIVILLVIIGAVTALFIIDYNNHEYYDQQISEAQDYLINKKYDKALKLCSNAKEIFETDERSYLVESDVYLAKGDKQKAKSVLEEALKITDSKNIRKKLDTIKTDIQYDEYISTGKELHKKNQFREAVSYFKSAISIRPDDPQAYLLAAESYLQNGEKAFARDILKTGFELTASDEIRGKMISIEHDLQSAQHQKDTQEQAEKEAKEAKRKADEEKRIKAEAEAKAKAEAEARKKAEKAAKNTEWKEAYKQVLLNYLDKKTNPKYENPYIRELDEFSDNSDSSDRSDSEKSDEEEESEEESSQESSEEESSEEHESSGESSESSGSEKKKKNDFSFELVDIDADGVPELFVSDANTDTAENECYTFANGAAIPIDNNSYIGKITYCKDEKFVRVTAIDNGIRHIDIYKKNGINMDKYISFFDNFAADRYTTGPKEASINGKKTDEYSYNTELRKYNSYVWTDIGRKYKLEENNIEKGIDAWHL